MVEVIETYNMVLVAVQALKEEQWANSQVEV